MKGVMLGYTNLREIAEAERLGMTIPTPLVSVIGNIYFNMEVLDCITKDSEGNIELQINGIVHTVKFDQILWDALKKHLQKNII